MALSAVSGLVDLARAEAAVLSILDSPGYSPPPPPRFPARTGYVEPSWGARAAVEMGDSYLGVEHAFLAMIRNRETVPRAHVFDPDGSLGRDVTREVLNSALVSLGRPWLAS